MSNSKLSLGETKQRPGDLFASCVYTTIHETKLFGVPSDKPIEIFSQRKRWTGAAKLLAEAREKFLALPIIFSDARSCRDLRWWGEIVDISVGLPSSAETTVKVRRLVELAKVLHEYPPRAGSTEPRKVPKYRTQQELWVLSTNNFIESGHQRTYVLCRTPKFISAAMLPAAPPGSFRVHVPTQY